MRDDVIVRISENYWMTVLLDAGDGTGAGIVPIPSELMDEMGWDENTRFEIELNDEGIMLRSLD